MPSQTRCAQTNVCFLPKLFTAVVCSHFLYNWNC